MSEHTKAPHLLIVEAPYYRSVTDGLEKGAAAEMAKIGAGYDKISVSGAFEIPAAIKFALTSAAHGKAARHYDGYIALGCVIRGETTHYDHICHEVNRALMDLALNQGLAIGNGVLTVENKDQAEARSGQGEKNKGVEAAAACLRQIKLKAEFGI